jgi:esterase/lipase superfamily enzyme
MAATVYFATNRSLTGPADQVSSYSTSMVDPGNPAALTYGTAYLDDANLTADTAGAVQSIQDVRQGGWSESAIGDLSSPGRDLMLFIHGFDNSFEDALTRAAYNQQWLQAGGGNYTMIAFSWPSLGQLLGGLLDLTEPYKQDQSASTASGPAMMSFLANVLPIATAARQSGRKVNLLCHSMGNWALAAAVGTWFADGQGPAQMFDTTVLAAADEVYDSFSYPVPQRLTQLRALSRVVRFYFNRNDDVLALSSVVNGVRRLGQDGPKDWDNATLFPATVYTAKDCTDIADYDVSFLNSHQYYRLSPAVRADIAAVF